MRRRRRMLLAVGLLLAIFALLGGGLLFAAKREPEFYIRTPCPADWDTHEKAAKLLTRVQEFKNEIRSKSEWGDTFTADELNCFFVANMSTRGGLGSLLPGKFHAPRVAIDGDRLKLGFKYGHGFWSAVVWVELRVWLVANKSNLVAVEVCDLRAGQLPIGSQSILDGIAEAARDSNIEVTWYRYNSNPVGLFRFYADQPQPASQIMTFDVKDGKIVVAGKTLSDQPGPPIGFAPLANVKP